MIDYNRAVLYMKENMDKSYMKDLPYIPIYISFLGYCILNGFSIEEYNGKKENFIRFILGISDKNDLIKSIITSKEKDEAKKAYIEFYFSDIDFKNLNLGKESLNVLKGVKNEAFKEECLLKEAMDPKLLSLRTGLDLSHETKIKTVFNYIERNSFRMLFLPSIGIFLELGIDFSFENSLKISGSDLFNILKASGEATRFKILHGLNKKELTSMELSLKTGVSLSTINHHLKTLIESKLVLLNPESIDKKSSTYSLNKDYIKDLCDYIKNSISMGGVEN